MSHQDHPLPAADILRNLLENSPDLVAFLDPERRVVWASRTFVESTGLDHGALFFDALDPFTAAAGRKIFEGLESGTQLAGTTAVQHLAREGQASLPAVFSWTVCRDAAGRLLGFWGVGRETATGTGQDEDASALREQIAALHAEGERRAREIVRLRRKMETHSQIDDLTGLGNRQFIMDRLNQEIPRAIRYDEPLTLLLFDIDRLDDVNERYGQATGDEVLKRIADVVREQVRSTDIVSRFGGEEFMILCPHTDRASSHFLAERLRRRVSEISFSGRGEEFGVTISTGLVTVTARTEFDVEALLQAVHDALSAAKHGGRNRIQLLEAR